jgi:hypothetical protein
MTAFNGARIKDRSYKVARRRAAMPVTGTSVFVLQSIAAAKADEARRHIEAQRALDAKRAKR